MKTYACAVFYEVISSKVPVTCRLEMKIALSLGRYANSLC